MKHFSLIALRKETLKRQRADDIVNRANDAFEFTILRERVRTQHPELCPFRQKKGSGEKVVKLTPVVALAAELSSNISKEVEHGSEGVRFKFK
jgi:hypothetical protein